MGPEAADKIIAGGRPAARRVSPGKLKAAEIAKLHEAMRNVNLHDGQSMTLLRYANRVPLQFQAGACAITQTVMGTNWRSYGLSQSRGSMPSGPVTLMVHMASVWVPFTSESKEAMAGYPEIQKELRLALQAVGRKLGMYPPPPQPREARGAAAGDLPPLPGRSGRRGQPHQPAPTATASTNGCWKWPKKRTVQADVRLDDRGRPIEDEEADFGKNVLIVETPATQSQDGEDLNRSLEPEKLVLDPKL